MTKSRIIISVLILCFLIVACIFVKPLTIFAQTASGNIATIVGGFIIRNPVRSVSQNSSLYFLTGTEGLLPSNTLSQIKSTNTQDSPLKGSLEFYTNRGGKLARAMTLSPDGSLTLGGYANKDTATSYYPPDSNNPAGLDQVSDEDKKRYLFDFHMAMFEQERDTFPRLYLRSLTLHERGDPVDLAIERSGPDNPADRYGPPLPVAPGASLGNIYWAAFGTGGDVHGRQAEINARNDITPTSSTNHPGSLHFSTAGVGDGDTKTRMSIQSNGYVGIGTGTNGAQALLHVAGDALANGSWRQSSDAKLKENIKPLENSLDKVLGLKGVSFKLKDSKDQATQIGVIAQDVEKIVPEVVRTEGDGYKSVSYQNLVPLLIEAIKEQQKEIDSLKAEINN